MRYLTRIIFSNSINAQIINSEVYHAILTRDEDLDHHDDVALKSVNSEIINELSKKQSNISHTIACRIFFQF